MRFLLLALLLIGCGARVDAPPVPVPETIQSEGIELAEARKQEAHWKAMVKALEEKADAERKESQRRWLFRTQLAGIAGALVCVFLMFWLPLAKKTLAMAAAGCLAVVVMAYTISAALDWMWVFPLLIVPAALVAVIYYLWVRLQAAIRSVGVSTDKTSNAWSAIKEHLLQVQGGEGSPIQRDLDRLAKRLLERKD